MLPSVLISLGFLFTGVGVIGLVCLTFQPFFNAIRVYFFHKKKDLSYESDKGRAAVERAYSFLIKSFVFLLIIGLICLVPGLWLKYAPRGNDSLWSENINGVAAGNDSMEYQQSQESGSTGNNVVSNGNSYFYWIVVIEKTIYVNEQEIGGTAEFEEYLEKMDRMKSILLEDNFAVSPTYHKVKELLDAHGLNYAEKERDD